MKPLEVFLIFSRSLGFNQILGRTGNEIPCVICKVFSYGRVIDWERSHWSPFCRRQFVTNGFRLDPCPQLKFSLPFFSINERRPRGPSRRASVSGQRRFWNTPGYWEGVGGLATSRDYQLIRFTLHGRVKKGPSTLCRGTQSSVFLPICKELTTTIQEWGLGSVSRSTRSHVQGIPHSYPHKRWYCSSRRGVTGVCINRTGYRQPLRPNKALDRRTVRSRVDVSLRENTIA